MLACGGTRLQASGDKITSETVWNEGAQGGSSGGGVSSAFALPAWQNGLQVTPTAGAGAALTARGVPDVQWRCGPTDGLQCADRRFRDRDRRDQRRRAALGRLDRSHQFGEWRPVGFVNPTLYESPAALNDITQGNNGDFAASAGWDACTGLGSPKGAQIATLFGSAATS